MAVVGVDHRLLIELNGALVGIESSGDEVPDARGQGPLAGHFVHGLAVTGPERQAAAVVDAEAVTTAAGGIELRDQTLATLARRGRPQEGMHGEAAAGQQTADRVGDLDETAGLGELGLEVDRAIHAGGDLTLDETRATGRDVAVQHAHQLHLGARHACGAEHELHSLARSHGEAIDITGDEGLSHYFGPPLRMKSSRLRRNTACKASF